MAADRRTTMIIRSGLVALVMGVLTGCAGAAESDGAIALEEINGDLDRPVFLTHAGDGSGRLFVLEQEGRIVILDGAAEPSTFLDIEDQIACCGERGLLGLAFHPDFPDDPRFFVNYTRDEDGATVVSEFTVDRSGAADPASERVLLTIAQPYGNHNGGMIAFGPDGYLYVGMGDGGSGGDPHNLGQDTESLLGKMLRIGVDSAKPYAIPSDNPYATGGGRAEIYAIGLRNPWRFSFDRATGELWVADVGQNAVEEVDLVELGGNYGWRIKEGTRDFEGSAEGKDLIPPIAEYAHADGRCSVTGGYVYRGEAVPDLEGTYVFADYCNGDVFGFADGELTVLLASGLSVSSFGEDEAGELYLLDHDGAVHRVVAREDGG